jgi:hypothetical protein
MVRLGCALSLGEGRDVAKPSLSKGNHMKTKLKIAAMLGVCLLITGSTTGYAQDKDATKEIGSTIRHYFHAMATRDVDALQGVLEKTFIVVEAGGENAKAHVVNSDDPSKLLPPEGNDDWQNLQVADLKVSLSSTHPTVATVAYTVVHPLDAEDTKDLQDVLRTSVSSLDQSQRQQIYKRLADGGSKESECAMLVLRDGRWRIVSISVPE